MNVAVYSFVDGPVRVALQNNGIEVALAPGGSNAVSLIDGIKAAPRLFWFMFRRRPRVVHFFLPAAYLAGAPMAVLAGVPIRVMSRRSLNVYQRNALVRVVERCWHQAMHAIIGNSQGVIDELKTEGVVAARLGLIYNGVDDASFDKKGQRDQTRAGLGLAPDTLVMCIVANLIPYKGHSDLIEALGLAAPQLPPRWHLLVIGHDAGIGAALQEQVSELGLNDHISFLGAREDIPALLAASDIDILCSHQEGFANAILEGMAAGLPMIVTRVGGNVEAVIDQETGLVVPPRDSKSLAAAIVQLANDASLRMRFGAAGRQLVARQFSVQRFVDGHRALYDALSAGKQPSQVSRVAIR